MKVNIPKEGKSSIEIENHDLWNLDETLASIIAIAMEEYIKEADEFHEQRPHRKEELHKIAWAMHQIANSNKYVYSGGQFDELHQQRIKEGLNLFAELFTTLWI